MSKKVTILGCGKIGRLVACSLAQFDDYEIIATDITQKSIDDFLKVAPALKNNKNITFATCDFADENDLSRYLKERDYVVSCAPFYLNKKIARVAHALEIHYLDLTEDVDTSTTIEELAQNSKTDFIPQCGLAPGYIIICTRHLMRHVDEVHNVKMRVGALPMYPNNRLKYNLTWSVDGLINEYCNDCEAIYEGSLQSVRALEGYERFEVEGARYEAFNTSGGLGTFARNLPVKVKNMDYKSIRYEGHCEIMRTLLWDLRFKEDRQSLKKIFEHSLPTTTDDTVILFAAVNGMKDGKYIEEIHTQRFLPQHLFGMSWSAIQLTTALSICTVLDLHANQKINKKGFIHQHDIPFKEFVENRFGKYFQQAGAL